MTTENLVSDLRQPCTFNECISVRNKAATRITQQAAEIERLGELVGRGVECRMLYSGETCQCLLCRRERELAAAHAEIRRLLCIESVLNNEVKWRGRNNKWHAEQLAAAQAELTAYREFVGEEMVRSDYQTVEQMRAEIARLKETAGRGMSCRVLSQGINCKCALCRTKRELASANEMLAANRAEVSKLEAVVREMSGELAAARGLLSETWKKIPCAMPNTLANRVYEFLESPPSPRAEPGADGANDAGTNDSPSAELGEDSVNIPESPTNMNDVPVYMHSNGQSTERNCAEAAMLSLGLVAECNDFRVRDKVIFALAPWIQAEREARAKSNGENYITLWRRVVQAGGVGNSETQPLERALQEVDHWAEERKQLKAEIEKQRQRAELAEEWNGGLRVELSRLDHKARGWYAVCHVLDELSPGWAASTHGKGMDSAVAAIRELAALRAKVPCEPMTGEQIEQFFHRYPGNTKESWMSLAEHIRKYYQPQPKPDRRKQLASQIVRTEHGEHLTVLELEGRVAYVDRSENGTWYVSAAGESADEINHCGFADKEAAEKIVREWLICRAMEGESP